MASPELLTLDRLAIESTDLSDQDQVASLLQTALDLLDQVRGLEADLAVERGYAATAPTGVTTPHITLVNAPTASGAPSNRWVGEVRGVFAYREAIAFTDDLGYNLPTILNRVKAMVEQAFKPSMVGPVVDGRPSWARAPRFHENNRLNIQVWIEGEQAKEVENDASAE